MGVVVGHCVSQIASFGKVVDAPHEIELCNCILCFLSEEFQNLALLHFEGKSGVAASLDWLFLNVVMNADDIFRSVCHSFSKQMFTGILLK